MNFNPYLEDLGRVVVVIVVAAIIMWATGNLHIDMHVV